MAKVGDEEDVGGVNSDAELKSVQFTTAVASTRASFLAGFCYYQIGRYNFTPGNDTGYIVLTTGAFCLAILAAALSATVSFFLDRNKTYRSKKLFVRFTSSVFVRGSFQCYNVALLCYTLGLSRIGFVYYPLSPSAQNIPYVIFLITSVLILISFAYIFRAKNIAESENSLRGGINEHFNLSQTLELFNVVANRSVYIAGMAQNGILRYLEVVPNDEEVSNTLGHAFLVFACLSTALSLLCAFPLSTLSVALQSTTLRAQKYFSTLCQILANLCFSAYTLSFICLGFTMMLMPWGCSYPAQGGINVALGLASLLLLIVGIVRGYCAYRFASTREEEEEGGSNVRDAASETLFISKSLGQINEVGSQATLASAFLFYNVVTFQTDILALPFHQLQQAQLFLFANVLAITSGLTSAILDSIITVFTYNLPLDVQKSFFLRAVISLSSLTESLFYLALVGWYVVFGLFGFTKYTSVSYTPIIFASIGFVVTALGATHLNSAKVLVDLDISSRRLEVATAGKDERREAASSSQCIARPALLNQIAFRVLFLGGFAYNAVNFFQLQPAGAGVQYNYDACYLIFMSLCFALSLTIVTWAAVYNIKMLSCSSLQAKIAFGEATRGFYLLSCWMAAGVVVTLFVGFGMVGFVKDRIFYLNWFDMAPVMVIASIMGGVGCVVAFFVVRKAYLDAIEIDSSSNNDGPTTSSSTSSNNNTFSYQRIETQFGVAASMSSFIAGNVCYEILFTQTLGQKAWNNYWYMCGNNWTFAAGTTVVAVSTLITFYFAELHSDAQKIAFGKQAKQFKKLIFFLTVSSLFTWIVGSLWLGRIKYTSTHLDTNMWIPSFAFGIFGGVVTLFSGIRIRYLSDVAMRESEKSPLVAHAQDGSSSFSLSSDNNDASNSSL